MLAVDKRVADPEEDRFTSVGCSEASGCEERTGDDGPWEWRNSKMTLEECKAECNLRPGCVGVEFESGDDDPSDCVSTGSHTCGTSDCVTIQRAGTMHTARVAMGRKVIHAPPCIFP